jgi:hypothetical protein
MVLWMCYLSTATQMKPCESQRSLIVTIGLFQWFWSQTVCQVLSIYGISKYCLPTSNLDGWNQRSHAGLRKKLLICIWCQGFILDTVRLGSLHQSLPRTSAHGAWFHRGCRVMYLWHHHVYDNTTHVIWVKYLRTITGQHSMMSLYVKHSRRTIIHVASRQLTHNGQTTCMHLTIPFNLTWCFFYDQPDSLTELWSLYILLQLFTIHTNRIP